MTQEQDLVTLFERWAQEDALDISRLPQTASDRKYFRIRGHSRTAIGACNPDRKENIAFLEFSRHFHRQGLPVPEIYAEQLDRNIYLIQDLGDTTLFTYGVEHRQADNFPEDLLQLYKQVIEYLPKFQIPAGQDLKYTVCYPRDRFDRQSMLWDLNYFKYYFLKLAKIPHDEQLLEDDFQRFTTYLLQADCDFFLYRDFQSRNVMLLDGETYFIDYQGGRKGALHYDLASLLYDSKADLPPSIRAELLAYYLDIVNTYIPVDEREFTEYFYGYVLIRIMQAMGSYGYRGFYEKKTHFLQSIPYALNNLAWLLETVTLPVKLPMLTEVLARLIDSTELKQLEYTDQRLQVSINSFSFRRSIPVDTAGNGGGFVFDCRGLNNPGRHEQYQQLTGMDAPVIEFLEAEESVKRFLDSVYTLVEITIEDYIQRNLTHLQVNFGCTGGQHRSVYCAEMLSRHLREHCDVNVVLHHVEQEMKVKE